MITVVNPIYDCVFKYLMEDERIAKTLLTALLKKEVVSVEMRRHEHTNTTRNNISMFRIDFAARVKDENGEEKLMLIELQKTWVETEMLRFRRYLAAQYNAQENMLKVEKGERQFAIPMVAIYLLGHRVGNLKAPVIYVNHDAFNYDGKKVEKGMEDPFIGSLVHDSIIVQLPLLKGKVQNHLEKVLSVFDQTNRQPGDKKYINLDESKYEGDEEMMRIIQRLTAATVTADVREEMLVEDEYFSAIENRDTELMEQRKLLEKKDNEIAENKEQLAKKDNEIAQKDSNLITAAKYMLECELPISKIMQATGLTDEQINSLKNNA
ncbi:MAG TPA: hypothetical protein PLP97_04875 [Prevotella sp.]|nr:hypothetical protein [Prevotella sp.]